jgi:hypothetical protein
MEHLVIEGTDDTPSIELNKEENKIFISGMSLPEDVTTFYGPVINWLTKYFAAPNEKTTVKFTMTYFNTASSKIILDIFQLVKNAHENGHDVSILWEYEEDDEEMCETGEDFAEIIGCEVKTKEIAVL